MRSFAIISTIVAAAVALKCYDDATKGGSPTKTAVCAVGVIQCVKQIQNGTLDLFACDVPQNQTTGFICNGIPNGQCKDWQLNATSYHTCCCGTDLCNSAGFFQPLLAASVLVLGKLL